MYNCEKNSLAHICSQVSRTYMLQMYKCANVQMYKCANVQICKCTNVQMYKCTNVQMYNYKIVQMYNCKQKSLAHTCSQVSRTYIPQTDSLYIVCSYQHPPSWPWLGVHTSGAVTF